MYVKPETTITSRASNVTGLTYDGISMFYQGKYVVCYSLHHVLKSFRDWLTSFKARSLFCLHIIAGNLTVWFCVMLWTKCLMLIACMFFRTFVTLSISSKQFFRIRKNFALSIWYHIFRKFHTALMTILRISKCNRNSLS